MMACVGNKILAAPYAIIGSIGVVAQLPNFHRLLQRNDIDFEQITAGEYKRTLSLFAENTDKGRQKIQEDIDTIHAMFKDFIVEHRPYVPIDKVATGEHWPGVQALALNLVDELMTSDDYLLKVSQTKEIFQIQYQPKKSWISKFSLALHQAYHRFFPSPYSKYDIYL
jgi:serine protease SohB